MSPKAERLEPQPQNLTIQLEYVPLKAYLKELLARQDSLSKAPPRKEASVSRSLPYIYMFLLELSNNQDEPVSCRAQDFALAYEDIRQHPYTAEAYHELFPQSLYWSPSLEGWFRDDDHEVEVGPKSSTIIPLLFSVVPVNVESFQIEVQLSGITKRNYHFVNRAARSR